VLLTKIRRRFARTDCTSAPARGTHGESTHQLRSAIRQRRPPTRQTVLNRIFFLARAERGVSGRISTRETPEARFSDVTELLRDLLSAPRKDGDVQSHRRGAIPLP
jgi:hypothetical protein